MSDDRSSSAFGVFVDRCFVFNRQPLNLTRKTYAGIFYERLRSPNEVMMSLGTSIAIGNQGLSLTDGLLTQLDIDMYPSFYDAPNGDVPMPEEEELCVGGHAVTLLGVDEENMRLGFHHLFSSDWGNDGAGTLPIDYLFEHTNRASCFRWHGGPAPLQPEHANTFEANPDIDLRALNQARLKAFVDEFPDGTRESPWMYDHPDDDVVWMGRKLVGVGNGDTWLQGVVLIRGIIDDPLLVGWMFARIVDAELVDIEEFFIWPAYRGRGLGAALAGRTLLYACTEDVKRVRWLELEADAVVNERLNLRSPSWATAFEWKAPDDSVGWGIRRMSNEVPLISLLPVLGNLNVDGGLHLLWQDGTVSVGDHGTRPVYGLVIQHDVDRPNDGLRSGVGHSPQVTRSNCDSP